MRLAKLPRADGYRRTYQCVFGGLNENLAARDGELSAMENMTSDHYPLLSPRPARYLVRTLAAPHGLAARDRLCWVDGTDFYYDGAVKGTVTEGDKRFYFLNRWIVIWPDKRYYNTATDEFGSLEASLGVDGVVKQARFLSSASPGGLSDRCNCLVLDSTTVEGTFRPGDAVTIAGCAVHPENNRTLVVREALGSALYFYNDSLTLDVTASYEVGAEGLGVNAYNFIYRELYCSFELDAPLTEGDTLTYDGDWLLHVTRGGVASTIEVTYGAFGVVWLTFRQTTVNYSEPGAVTVSRQVPELEFLCESDNRLWGVKDQTVYCSCLGDPRVWYNYDGTATSAWSVEVGSGGAFTGAFAYGGYPLLFKEDHIYRVYGTKPSNFQLMDTCTLGCEAGSDKSFAVVGQTLYYKTRAGFAAYAGGVPALIDEALGPVRREDAVAGTDGRKYYVSVESASGARDLYVYDTALSLWHREDDAQAMDFAWCGGELYMLGRDGGLWQLGRIRTPVGTAEASIASAAEFADFYDGSLERKTIARVYLRVQTSGTLTLLVSYDGGPWLEAGRVLGRKKGMQTLELIPRRCDGFRIRLEGEGDWKLWAMGREYQAGTPEG